MTQLLRDARHALRVLAARPVLTATTVLTLALGIGGTSAMFSIASAVLLRPLPVPDADRLVRIFGTTEARTLGIVSYPNLKDVADRAWLRAKLGLDESESSGGGGTVTVPRWLWFTMVGLVLTLGLAWVWWLWLRPDPAVPTP